MGKIRIHINLQNPKTYLALLLFFGCLFVLIGTGIESFTANTNLCQTGWYMIAGSAGLWVLGEAISLAKH